MMRSSPPPRPPRGAPARRAGVLLTALLLPAGIGPAAVCDPVPGADPVLKAGTVLLLGEIHGTDQAPAAVSRIACEAIERGIPLIVALEIPGSESPRLARFLSGDPQGEDALLEGEFWRREHQDGRSSAAMFNLISALRNLDPGGDLIRIHFFDEPDASVTRDRAMADRLAAGIEGMDDRLVVVLTGNIHNRLTVGTPWNSRLEPMGYLFREDHPDRRIVSVNITHSGGTAWTCSGGAASDCSAGELRGREGVDPGFRFDAPYDGGPYHGTLHVGPITASQPAVRIHHKGAVASASAAIAPPSPSRQPESDSEETMAPRYLNSPGSASLNLPFSEAVRVGETIYLSGQLGNKPGTLELVPGGIGPETRQTMENIRAMLERHGSSLDHVVKCTIFLADISEWGAMNEVYRTFFTRHLPARSALGASGLALGARVEIECIAVAAD